jgi:hypothetical protein
VGGRPQSAATKMSDSLTDGPAAGAMRRSQTGARSSAEAGSMEHENPEMHRATCTRRRRAAQPQPTIPILTQCRISWSRGASLAAAAARRCGRGVVGPGGAPPRTGRWWRRPSPLGSSAGSARSPTAALRRRPARRQPRGASLCRRWRGGLGWACTPPERGAGVEKEPPDQHLVDRPAELERHHGLRRAGGAQRGRQAAGLGETVQRGWGRGLLRGMQAAHLQLLPAW